MAEKANPSPQTDAPPTGEQSEFFGGGNPPAPSPPELVELEIGPKKVKLEKSAAEAFSAMQDQYKRDLEARDREIRNLKALPPPKPQEDEFYTPDLDTRFFEK